MKGTSLQTQDYDSKQYEIVPRWAEDMIQTYIKGHGQVLAMKETGWISTYEENMVDLSEMR